MPGADGGCCRGCSEGCVGETGATGGVNGWETGCGDCAKICAVDTAGETYCAGIPGCIGCAWPLATACTSARCFFLC